jgi:bifunctional non-homologous end joining protein LigD
MARSAKKSQLNRSPEAEAGFVEPMLCEPVKQVPSGKDWIFEVKLDGFRIVAAKPAGEAVTLWTRNRISLNRKFFYIADALSFLPEGTVLDGELIALDAQGKSQFGLLQSFRSAAPSVRYSAFDVVRLKGRDVTGLPLLDRKALLMDVMAKRPPQILLTEFIEDDATAMLKHVRAKKLEGIVAKKKQSLYEPGERSGAWVKHRVNQGQEFVVGGYMPGPHGIEALIVGFYRGPELLYVASLRAGFTTHSREQVFMRIKDLRIDECPFANLPQEGARSRWGGEGLNSEKMKKCIWVKPKVVVQVEFLEWTGDTHLRHAKFVGLREDKSAREVVRES